jgi:predicted restriction endonuclease
MSNKKEIRNQFRQDVFVRAKYHCQSCTKISTSDRATEELDAHHITDRHDMPNGGYVKENGIALCKKCHEKAEIFHSTGVIVEGWTPEDLYKLIDSSYEQAVEASGKLKN